MSTHSETGDSSIYRIVSRDYNPDNEKYNSFINNEGRMSDGFTYYVNTPYESYNVLTNISLSISDRYEISKSSTRFSKDLDSVFVYVNGFKVPDSMVYLFINSNNTPEKINKSNE
jgi:hypothetical protein